MPPWARYLLTLVTAVLANVLVAWCCAARSESTQRADFSGVPGENVLHTLIPAGWLTPPPLPAVEAGPIMLSDPRAWNAIKQTGWKQSVFCTTMSGLGAWSAVCGVDFYLFDQPDEGDAPIVFVGAHDHTLTRLEAGWPFKSLCGELFEDRLPAVPAKGASVISGPEWAHPPGWMTGIDYVNPTYGLPCRPMAWGFIANTLFYTPLAAALMFGPAAVRSFRQRGMNCCPACGYDRRGLGPAPCPECGASPGR